MLSALGAEDAGDITIDVRIAPVDEERAKEAAVMIHRFLRSFGLI